LRYNNSYKLFLNREGMNILITGGLGFIGSNLAHKCVHEGHCVTLLSHSEKKKENISEVKDDVKIILKDIRDISSEDVAGMDYIFHCASTVDNYNIQDNPYLDTEVNCNGTTALLEACRNGNPGVRIVYASTFFVNGNLDKLPATPNSPCNPLGIYPATRLAGEQFCKAYNQTFGMNATIARFTNVFGQREQAANKKKAAFNQMLAAAMRGEEIPLYSNGEFIRDYIHVEDVVDALLIIAEKGKKGEVYYVGRGEKTNFGDLMKMVIEEAGSGTLKSIEPPKFHKAVGIKDFYCDNALLKELGWTPQVSLRQGIRKTIDYYQQTGEIAR